MGETPIHRRNISNTIETLDCWFANDPLVYVSGNMFMYYTPGNRHLSVVPDVFVVKGVPKKPERRVYLVWQEGKGPDIAIEFTSLSTREEDRDDKFVLYSDTLRIPEYFLFDPTGEYLDPALCGYRLHAGEYLPIDPVEGRLPSLVLGLHLEAVGLELRLYDHRQRRWLLTPREEYEARQMAESELLRERKNRKSAEAEIERLRQELDRLRGSQGQKSE